AKNKDATKKLAPVWGPSTIYGNWQRGTGILNNELYIGQLIWNRQHFIKDPRSGKRQARLNPHERWLRQEVPHLRIIPQDLWDAVKARQGIHRQHRPEKARRPVHLLSGLLVCGECGGGVSMISAHHYGCSRARNSGTCTNRLNIRKDTLESQVLAGLRQHLMQPAAVKAFVEEFTREVNRLAADHDDRRVRLETEFDKIEMKQRSLMDAIMDGTPARLVNAELAALETRRSEIEAQLQAVPPPLPRLHPNLPELFRRKVEDLQEALREPETTTQAALALRGLIDRIRLVPVNGALEIELEGARAALLALATPESKHPRSGEGSGVQETVVAGAGFEPATFRL
ncbi:DNA recombinase, partial [Paramagnetospirillum caucaseum]